MKNRPYQQLSDHFGISVELSLPPNNHGLNESSLYNPEIMNIK